MPSFLSTIRERMDRVRTKSVPRREEGWSLPWMGLSHKREVSSMDLNKFTI
jgi:hypothetical protein